MQHGRGGKGGVELPSSASSAVYYECGALVCQ